MTFLPRGIADFFKNLDALSIWFCGLQSISANDLRPFPRLVYLFLDHNQLTTIDGDLFTYTPHLQYASFEGNQIQHIGHDLVTNLNSLTHLYFNENVCINQVARTLAEISTLAPKLSLLCPPLTTPRIESTTSESKIDQCSCDDKIWDLGNQIDTQSRKIENQSKEIKQLIQDGVVFKKKLLEVETKLLEIGSTPCSS